MTRLADILAVACKTTAGRHVAVNVYAPWLEKYMPQFKITTKTRIAMFLAQVAHESADFTVISENLNYSAKGLAATWKRFRNPDGTPNELANKLARNAMAIASCVYANRMGNRGEESGDGWRTRGMGLIQLTGTDNRVALGKHFKIDFIANPNLLLQPEWATASACWYWGTNGLNEIADAGNFDHVCDKINMGRTTPKVGDAIGYADRKAYYDRALSGMPEHFSL